LLKGEIKKLRDQSLSISLWAEKQITYLLVASR
jgi:hypothetical protein